MKELTLDPAGIKDQYIQFEYGGKVIKTQVRANGGLKVKLYDAFVLNNFLQYVVNSGEEMVMMAVDKGSSDTVGAAVPMSYASLVNDERLTLHDVDLY